jgi:hypothetical protein
VWCREDAPRLEKVAFAAPARRSRDDLAMTMAVSTGPTRLEGAAARVLAVVSALWWGGLFFGMIDLNVALDQTPGFYESYVLETGWGLLYTFLVAAPCVALAVRPALTMPLVQLAAAGVAVAVTAVAGGSFGQLIPAALLLLNAAVLSRLGRGDVLLRNDRRLASFDLFMLGVVAPQVAVGVVYAVDMVIGFRTGRPPTDDDTWGLDHWPMQAALALTLALVAIGVAAGVRNRWSGTAFSAVCVTVTAAWFGVICVVYPGHAASIGATWGAVLIAWAAVFAVGTGWRMRHFRRGWVPGRRTARRS